VENALDPGVSACMRPLEKIEAGDSGGLALPGTPPRGEDTEETPDARRSDVDTRPSTPLTLLRPLAALPSLRISGECGDRAGAAQPSEHKEYAWSSISRSETDSKRLSLASTLSGPIAERSSQVRWAQHLSVPPDSEWCRRWKPEDESRRRAARACGLDTPGSVGTPSMPRT